MSKPRPARPGYKPRRNRSEDRTRDKTLTGSERKAGWEFVDCPRCFGQGWKNCGLCGGTGRIKALK